MLRKIGGLATKAKTSKESDPLAPFSAGDAALVRGLLRGADAGPGRRLGGDLRRRQRADLRPDRVRQDARQLPLGDRQAGPRPELGTGVKLVYVSPLKALSYDIERNLRAPLRGIGAEISVGLRTGDTSQKERRAMAKTPPDILITTPESLYLMLSSSVREILTGVEAVIVDEIHAVAQTKRGSPPGADSGAAGPSGRHGGRTSDRRGGRPPGIQRIGLSATQRPLERIASVPRRAEEEVQDRGCRAEEGRWTWRSSCRSRTWPTRGRPPTRARTGRRRPKSSPAPTCARSGRRSTRSSWSWSRNTPRRSSSSTTAAPPSAWPSA